MKSGGAILAILFKFPPYPGVGGFRWSKLCKYLARSGYKIHAVSVNWKQYRPDTLLEDITHENIIIHRIPSGYPLHFKYQPKRNLVFRFLRSRVIEKILDHFYFDDEAQHWGSYLIPFSESLLRKENINVVIATGSPFQSNRWAALLKSRNPQLRLIQDFRDPWLQNPFHPVHRRKLWTQKRIKKIGAWQEQALGSADAVVTVTKGLRELYASGSSVEKFHVIPNGYDDQYVQELDCSIPSDQNPKCLRLTYIGNLYCGRDRPFKSFLDGIERLGAEDSTLLKVQIIGSYGGWIKKDFSNLIEKKILCLYPPMSQKEAHRMVKNSNFALQFNSVEFPYLVSTKIYEYAMLKIPTISFNYGGEIEDLITENDLGYSVNLNEEKVEDFLKKLKDQVHNVDFKFSISKFSYKNIADRYGNLIHELTQ